MLCTVLWRVWPQRTKTMLVLQGTKILLNEGFAMKYDPRWADSKGDLAPDRSAQCNKYIKCNMHDFTTWRIPCCSVLHSFLCLTPSPLIWNFFCQQEPQIYKHFRQIHAAFLQPLLWTLLCGPSNNNDVNNHYPYHIFPVQGLSKGM
jgi:hypothetical protein